MGERGCAATSLPCAVPGLVARRATALDIGLSPNELSLSDSLVCILLEDLQKALLALFGLFVCVESVCVECLFFKDTGVQPHLSVGLISVTKKTKPEAQR